MPPHRSLLLAALAALALALPASAGATVGEVVEQVPVSHAPFIVTPEIATGGSSVYFAYPGQTKKYYKLQENLTVGPVTTNEGEERYIKDFVGVHPAESVGSLYFATGFESKTEKELGGLGVFPADPSTYFSQFAEGGFFTSHSLPEGEPKSCGIASSEITVIPECAMSISSQGSIIYYTTYGYDSETSERRQTIGRIGKPLEGKEITRKVISSPEFAYPQDMTEGPVTGTMWFLEDENHSATGWRIGKVIVEGGGSLNVLSFGLPSKFKPGSLAKGSDGNMYLSGTNSLSESVVLKITPGVAFSEVAATKGLGLSGGALGADGNLWYVTASKGLARLTMAGAVTTYKDPFTGTCSPREVVPGWKEQMLVAETCSEATGRFSIVSTK